MRVCAHDDDDHHGVDDDGSADCGEPDAHARVRGYELRLHSFRVYTIHKRACEDETSWRGKKRARTSRKRSSKQSTDLGCGSRRAAVESGSVGIVGTWCLLCARAHSRAPRIEDIEQIKKTRLLLLLCETGAKIWPRTTTMGPVALEMAACPPPRGSQTESYAPNPTTPTM